MVFGSMARASKTRKSDLDLMIIKETGKRFFDRYDEFDEIFELIKDRAIDILIYTPEELENISHRPFINKMIIKGENLFMSTEKNIREAKRWLTTADDDIDSAVILKENGKFAHSCFHAQQAGEKALKAVWFFADADP